jgi:alcohol dehydrogenase (NADP+)
MLFPAPERASGNPGEPPPGTQSSRDRARPRTLVSMRTLTLHDGTPLPAFGLGTWNSPEDEVYRAVRLALELGYRHLDCAHIYGNETTIGRALADAFAAGDVRREDVWVTSKLWNDRHVPADVSDGIETTLAALRLDQLDLYLVHWPVAIRPGVGIPKSAEDMVPLSDAPLAATWEAMGELEAAGLTRQIGVSNFNLTHIREVHAATGVLPAVNQVEMHPYLAQQGLVDGCRDLGVAVTAYSPLGTPSGAALFGTADDAPLLSHPVIHGIAEARGATAGQVLIAWALGRGTSVIPKSTNPDRLRENLAGADVSLTAEDVAAIGGLDRGYRYVNGSFWCMEGSPYSLADLWGK